MLFDVQLMFSIISVIGTMIIGTFIGYKILKIERNTSYLVSTGTAICGGSAIALFIFPIFGEWLGMRNEELGVRN